MSRFYVTTPIYYVNDRPHVGHAYTSIAADVIARWHRLKGADSFMLTGTDEHGQKVFQTAQNRGVSPQQHVDELSVPFRELLGAISVDNRDFIRTTERRHTDVVQAVLTHLKDKGDLYTQEYAGWYSTSEERFWTEKDLVDGKCPVSGNPVEWIEETNWFFKMSAYADQLRDWIADNPGFLQPDSRKNEVLGYLKKDVGDLCITRPKARLPWGIPLPFDPEFVTYVWFDALLNYITALGYHPDPSQRGPDFERYWPADFHLVGKDILTTHSVYWSTMLFALGLAPAKCLYAHGWWTIEGRKMSKTVGNVVDPHLLVDEYGVDPVRYFLLREKPFGGDGDFSHKGFLTRYNADLANDLGNMAHRALSMTEKWLPLTVPALDPNTPADDELAALTAQTAADFTEQIEGLHFSRALEALWVLVRAGNNYIQVQEPWAINRNGDQVRLAGVLRRCLEVCRVAATLLHPICPTKSAELAARLGINELTLHAPDRLDGLTEGAPLLVGDPLFPRLLELPPRIQTELDAALANHDAAAAKAQKKADKAAKKAKYKQQQETQNMSEEAKSEGPKHIKFEDFTKVELRSGTVLSAEKHPNADRLLVLKVDIGEAEPRQIVAGIATKFSPEELAGRTVVVVANLKPAKLRGVVSQGMMLAAGEKAVEALVTLGEEVPPGTIVR